jgi:hypothetical protein
VREGIETSADRAIDHLGADLDDQTAQDGGIDRKVDGNLAVDASLELALQFLDLRRRQRMGGGDLGRRLAAMGGGELRKCAITLQIWARRRFSASTPRKLAVKGSSFIAFATAATPRPLSPRESNGLAVSVRKSSDSMSAAFTVARLFSTVSILFASRAQIEQGGCIAPC